MAESPRFAGCPRESPGHRSACSGTPQLIHRTAVAVPWIGHVLRARESGKKGGQTQPTVRGGDSGENGGRARRAAAMAPGIRLSSAVATVVGITPNNLHLSRRHDLRGGCGGWEAWGRCDGHRFRRGLRSMEHRTRDIRRREPHRANQVRSARCRSGLDGPRWRGRGLPNGATRPGGWALRRSGGGNLGRRQPRALRGGRHEQDPEGEDQGHRYPPNRHISCRSNLSFTPIDTIKACHTGVNRLTGATAVPPRNRAGATAEGRRGGCRRAGPIAFGSEPPRTPGRAASDRCR
jgi:hypothetical protein